jgi:hypothetical protein
MNRSISYGSSPESSPDSRPTRMGLRSFNSYNVSTSPDTMELLPATTYVPPSPRGRLVQTQYVRPSIRLDHHMMPSPEEIMAAAALTRNRRSSSTSSTSSTDSISSTRSEKRQGRLFMPSLNGNILDLLSENRDMED